MVLHIARGEHLKVNITISFADPTKKYKLMQAKNLIIAIFYL